MIDKTKHPLAGTVICKDNFFNNPDKVLELSKKQEYSNNIRYPGKRTINLLESNDIPTKDFAIFFAKKIAREIFPGMSQFVIHISFHINDIYDDEFANIGWIHNDDVTLAGLVYLTPGEQNIDNGTSIFLKNGEQTFSTIDIKSRTEFNITKVVTEQYKKDLLDNHSSFEETIKVGNLYNRLIAYDSNLWHRPNNFQTNTTEPRTTLLFFIDGYQFDRPDIELTSNWID